MTKQITNDNPPLSKNQKITATGLAVFAVLVAVLWIVQLKNNIYGPFKAPLAKNSTVSEHESGDQALKSKDTDEDGLNDYDELNIHNTSPYLQDTDSDGFNDREEIEKGDDPNCPQGRTCSGAQSDDSALELQESPAGAENSAFSSLLKQFDAANKAENSVATNSAASLGGDQLDVLKNMDAANLRRLLLQAGMPKEMLDQISDADLMKTSEQILKK